ncbi:MAG: sugar dehydrogenase [Rhodospirillales bacterium 20-64-7]|nr:MAG: sugar dehydrogenase [Rhodospirillales bacterium 20-64-7]
MSETDQTENATPRRPDFRLLPGQRALVTGASSGIGLEVARRLARSGAAVAVNYHSHPEPAQALVEEITSGGGQAIAIGGDVSEEGDVAKMFARAAEALGGLDIVVTNSGLQKDAPVAKMTLADWQKVLDVNLTGQFLCCREAISIFRAQQTQAGAKSCRSIVCMSSVHQLIPWAGHVNYAASKGGIQMMMQTLAQEVAPDRIRVNAVAPGAIRTPINREAWETPEALQKLLKLIPYGRIGEPDDVARAVAWLASDEAAYVTGSTLFVDGGMKLYPGFEDNG